MRLPGTDDVQNSGELRSGDRYSPSRLSGGLLVGQVLRLGLGREELMAHKSKPVATFGNVTVVEPAPRFQVPCPWLRSTKPCAPRFAHVTCTGSSVELGNR